MRRRARKESAAIFFLEEGRVHLGVGAEQTLWAQKTHAVSARLEAAPEVLSPQCRECLESFLEPGFGACSLPRDLSTSSKTSAGSGAGGYSCWFTDIRVIMPGEATGRWPARAPRQSCISCRPAPPTRVQMRLPGSAAGNSASEEPLKLRELLKAALLMNLNATEHQPQA